MISGSFLELSHSHYISIVLLPAGALACVELKRFEEAITWCDKGLAVSFKKCFIFNCRYNENIP